MKHVDPMGGLSLGYAHQGGGFLSGGLQFGGVISGGLFSAHQKTIITIPENMSE